MGGKQEEDREEGSGKVSLDGNGKFVDLHLSSSVGIFHSQVGWFVEAGNKFDR